MTMAPEGRKLLRIEARNALVPIERKPESKKQRAQIFLNVGKTKKQHF